MITVNVENLTKNFNGHEVLQSVSLTFEAGKIYALVGRNGSGKSVLMKCIAGLVCPTSGFIEVFGKRIGRDVDFAPNTGIAIEQPGLLLNKSAYENMRILAALTSKPSDGEIIRLIELVGLNAGEKKHLGKYSMGMKQRLSIAMALLGDPDLLLLDEPMSNLDQTGANEMRLLFQRLARDGKTVVIATHIQSDVSELCSSICRFEEGRVTLTDNGAMG